jgi:hypothetical protein
MWDTRLNLDAIGCSFSGSEGCGECLISAYVSAKENGRSAPTTTVERKNVGSALNVTQSSDCGEVEWSVCGRDKYISIRTSLWR